MFVLITLVFVTAKSCCDSDVILETLELIMEEWESNLWLRV